jgi:cysteine desulfurase
MTARPVYLDHAAATPTRPEVVQAVSATMLREYANPSGAHRLARESRRTLDDARARIAAAVGASAGEVIFCSGGTEADNLAVRGFAAGLGGAKILVSAAEHHAVLDPAVRLGAQVAPVDRNGRVDLERFSELCSPEVGLVSVMLVNNEVGTVADLVAIKRILRKRAPHAILHTDAVQAANWLDLRTAAAMADSISLGAHKLGGPKGIGALIVREDSARRGAALEPQLLGGGQERDRRSGTQDVASAVGFAVALEAVDRGREAEHARIGALRDALLDGLLDTISGSHATVPNRDLVVPGIAHLCIEGVESEALLFLLERHEVMASAASSCASGAQQSSHVLSAMGVPAPWLPGALRLSLGHTTVAEDVERALVAIPESVTRLRKFG